MNLKSHKALGRLFSQYLSVSDCSNTEPDSEFDASVIRFVKSASDAERSQVVQELDAFINKALAATEPQANAVQQAALLETLGMEANLWLGTFDEAFNWLKQLHTRLLAAIRTADSSSLSSLTETKDSNGAILNEGDTVTVIKDLKVKGGTSDLKRGTTIKKIHLIDDTAAIECRVDGSTLVLKTCFLRKVTE